MDTIFDFILNNKEWIFSGVGVTFIGWLIRKIFRRKDSDDKPEEILRATFDDIKKYDPKTKELLHTLEYQQKRYLRCFPSLNMVIFLIILIFGLGIFLVLVLKLVRWIISIF